MIERSDKGKSYNITEAMGYLADHEVIISRAKMSQLISTGKVKYFTTLIDNREKRIWESDLNELITLLTEGDTRDTDQRVRATG